MALKNSIDQLIRSEWNKAAPVARITKNRSGASATKSAPERNSAITATHWVETYTPSNCDKYEYYRYVWMEGRKLRHRHILGGNIQNPKAIALKEKVETAIAQGLSTAQIRQLIRSQGSCGDLM